MMGYRLPGPDMRTFKMLKDGLNDNFVAQRFVLLNRILNMPTATTNPKIETMV
jgi:hypothetical protein